MRSLLTILIAFTLCAALAFLLSSRSRGDGASPVPTRGGLALLAATLSSAFVLWPADRVQWTAGAGAAALALVCWADDRYVLPGWLRLCVMSAVAALLAFALPGDALVFQGALPLVADRLITIAALIALLNLTSAMDEIDGLVCLEAVVIAAGYVAVTLAADGTTAPYHGLALALGGAALGFFAWGSAPARLRLGDLGSVPAGFIMGALLIDIAVRHSLAAAVILALYFAADAALTIARRVSTSDGRRQVPNAHSFQRAAEGLGSDTPVVARMAVANALLVIAAVLALTAPTLALIIAAAIVAILLLSLERAARAGSASQ